MFERRLSVALDGKVRRFTDMPFAQALHDLTLVDAALLHSLLRMLCQDDAIAVLDDNPQLLEEPGIAKAHWLDCSHTYIVYGFLQECQARVKKPWPEI